MPSSREKILTCATECFFQHGYIAANISMIARYSQISRVTIHKQFRTKEALFRAVVEKYISDNNVLLQDYSQSDGDFWAETEAFILKRCDGLFEEVSSSLIRTDLLHAGQSHCNDIITENEIEVRKIISLRVSKELTENRMTLSKIDITVEAFARIIESAPFGLALSSLEEDNQAFVKQLMKVFKASTSI
ncbi:TetR/AcrR family transcriptional regulator [Pseudoalteromonas denitrificans]|uniref:Transcriptional regulator, TetR family n=1 Tax=Pseudoalteromonas denitrificans DSM 6059 TaxID=1123010 RepID=A0A1I1NSN1_9GAMM|nr:TetR/AcrR family transcriptional regulator [Pseudoalteromonas denitrificans]SFD00674.1 transcriptional regulator, TetR family [Pseudoalteromonas denitrificans DSM 6059]